MKSPNLIIIEGVDKSGKTEVSDFLIAHIKNSILIKGNMRPYDNTPDENQKIKDYYTSVMTFINNNLREREVTYILDRFYPSQMVYSYMRTGDDMYNPWYFGLEETVSTYPHLLLYANPGMETIKSRLEDEGDEYVNLDDIEHLRYRYSKFYDSSKLRKDKIVTDLPLKRLENEIIEIIESYFPNINLIGVNP